MSWEYAKKDRNQGRQYSNASIVQICNAKDPNNINARQEFLSERERISNTFNLLRLNLNQTADLAGGGPLHLIGGAMNEWQISRGAAPHERSKLVSGF
jgi:hypothetical protein